MKHLVIILLVFFLQVVANAGNDGGGGDPVAAEFSNLTSKLAIFVKNFPEVLPTVEPQKLINQAKRIRNSLGNNTIDDLIEVVEKRPKIKGVHKAAVYDRKSGRIKVHRKSWVESTQKQKILLVTLENLGLQGLNEDRYNLSFNKVEEHYIAILAIDDKWVESEIKIGKKSNFSGYGKIFLPENARKAYSLYKCNKDFSECERLSKDINGHALGHEPNYWYYFRPGNYLVSADFGHFDKRYTLKDESVIVLEPPTEVFIKPWQGPGSVEANIYLNLDSEVNREKLISAKLSGIRFPIKLSDGDFQNPDSFNEKGVYYKTICKMFVSNYAHPSVHERHKTVCRDVLVKGFVAKDDFLDLEANILSSIEFLKTGYEYCVGSCGGSDSKIFKRNREKKELSDFLNTHPMHRIMQYNDGILDWYVVSVPKSGVIKTNRSRWPVFPGSTFYMMPGEYVAYFTNESGATLDIPFEILQKQKRMTIDIN